ncbi:hypothetical protein [Clostridium paraputrificum]|jgi:hypothetical protein|uniref:hypothetical protein n=1 Tax=Clostridium paraputrificum TaxID=29363 RepID=UPI000C0687F7|nr:hypothetical protein [Clostridium paraputrificum]DAU44826.1 MAG TPA: hypothetical protein [Caudoviricetes sp.]
MENVIIKTCQALDVLRIVNKLGIKDTLIELISKVNTLNTKRENEFRRLRDKLIEKCGGSEAYSNLTEEEKKEISQKSLEENNDIQENILNIDNEIVRETASLVYDFATRIPQAEKEVYTCLSKIFNKDIKEIESQEFTETIEMIKTIIKSESVQVFFKLAPR